MNNFTFVPFWVSEQIIVSIKLFTAQKYKKQPDLSVYYLDSIRRIYHLKWATVNYIHVQQNVGLLTFYYYFRVSSLFYFCFCQMWEKFDLDYK